MEENYSAVNARMENYSAVNATMENYSAVNATMDCYIELYTHAKLSMILGEGESEIVEI